MDTIKNYLETMFANLPNTAEVRKAKDELWQMMEDKYTELINDGATENEAVGTVISEFGNLDEIADDLGLKNTVEAYEEKVSSGTEPEKRKITMQEARAYIKKKKISGILLAIGVFFCIASIVSMIATSAVAEGTSAAMADVLGLSGVLGTVFIVFIGVAFIIPSQIMLNKYSYIKHTPCVLDYQTAKYVANEKDKNTPFFYASLLPGIFLCVLCWFPAAVVDELNIYVPGVDMDSIMAIPLFILVALGVFFILLATQTNAAYTTLLELNDNETISGTYKEESKEIVFENEALASWMENYWTIVTCIYLIISFLTFAWAATWVIWPVAGLCKILINNIFGKKTN